MDRPTTPPTPLSREAPPVRNSPPFTKGRPGAPAGFFAAEAAGLRWLADAGTVPVVRVLEEHPEALVLERWDPVAPTTAAANAFGAGLAALHDTGAEAMGWTPGPHAWFGPLDAPMEVSARPRDDLGTWWARDRLDPMLDRAAPTLGPEGVAEVRGAVDAVAEGAFDGIAGGPVETPARLHGDLWAGNLLWTSEGVVLIDPAAHGGHRLEDLAMLSLFGAPHLAEILAGYEHAHPLPADWREDVPVHQLFGLLAHVALFGPSYVEPAREAARATTARAERLRG